MDSSKGWEHLARMMEQPPQSQPVVEHDLPDDLEAQIRQAQDQLVRLKRQRQLIEIQQQVADEERALEDARLRLVATMSKEPTPPTPTKPAPRAIENNDSPPTSALPAHTPKRPAAADRRVSDTKAQKDGTPTRPITGTLSALALDQLRALAAASRSPTSAAIKTEPTTLAPTAPVYQASYIHPSDDDHNHGPPVPNVPVYNGRALGEYKNYTMGLDRHFAKYAEYYDTDQRKLTRALKHITLNLEDEWKRHTRNLPSDQVTYSAFCTFLIHQLQNGVYPEIARARYKDSYQRPAQSVTDFSNWMQQWEPHFNERMTERDRMRHLFEHLLHKVRNEAEKTYLDFTNYNDFVAYLQQVEDNISVRNDALGRRGNPRKRHRSHS
ncbi:hypothetical protein PENANT_c001G05778 [Penicillium antarcticum]|uniref:Uncharacterized protein n=1 Tax=Penicillium antarcticum TaxID=416450 RepID=A0A1V6QNH4_9EURO|nr:uncharacterized protein N7508_010264 [Penicillium antarcticum]KAJ5295443.1 hypothetical protein N7508_010264 [Penicillium antarcticum]OQD90789.1 hypothetical protein PENANT_c001G05778 [Penicillium antarcticum]